MTPYYLPMNGPLKAPQRLSSWACTLEDSVFELRGDGHHVRKRDDSFVGTAGRPIYQASKGFALVDFDPIWPLRLDSNGRMEMVRFPVDENEQLKAPRMQVKGVRIGSIMSLGERAMEGMIPSQWFSMGHWSWRRGPAPEAFWRTLVADRSANGSNPPTWYKRALEHALLYNATGDVITQRIINHGKSSVTTELLKRVQSVIWNRRFVITDRGAFGLVPAKAQAGDVIMVLYGASVPVVLRKLVSSYWLVGECYIHGAMDGLRSHHGAGESINYLDVPRITADMVEIVNIR